MYCIYFVSKILNHCVGLIGDLKSLYYSMFTGKHRLLFVFTVDYKWESHIHKQVFSNAPASQTYSLLGITTIIIMSQWQMYFFYMTQ